MYIDEILQLQCIDIHLYIPYIVLHLYINLKTFLLSVQRLEHCQ